MDYSPVPLKNFSCPNCGLDYIYCEHKKPLKVGERIRKKIPLKESYKLKLEEEKIVKSMALFAYFLETHSITPYNDATERFLNKLIKQAEDQVFMSLQFLYGYKKIKKFFQFFSLKIYPLLDNFLPFGIQTFFRKLQKT